MKQDLSWQTQARCAIDDQDVINIFYYDEETDDIDYTKTAQQICATCPVRVQCLQYALDNEERFGVWGGSDESTRRWALSIDMYGKPLQRIRPIKCPNCSSTELLSAATTRTKTRLKCAHCDLTWWSRKLSDVVPIVEDEENAGPDNES